MNIQEKYKVANPTNNVSYKKGTKGWWNNSFEGICYCVRWPEDNTQYECEFISNDEHDSFVVCKNEKLGLFACQYFYPIDSNAKPQK